MPSTSKKLTRRRAKSSMHTNGNSVLNSGLSTTTLSTHHSNGGICSPNTLKRDRHKSLLCKLHYDVSMIYQVIT
ncbi:hypothetical protein Tcan_08927 [Toxocara canis]|uniref:Uncharacterized protein n=1 Tax=Toxocara canis TaxID=6265 RepID=A0A0B2W0K4_TOXCA|nr:hypothetical protein Tcan_08927 [Toxocara canis]